MNRLNGFRVFLTRFEFHPDATLLVRKREIDRWVQGCASKLPPGSLWRIERYVELVTGEVMMSLEYEVNRDEPVYKDWVAKNTAQQPESGA